MAIETPTMVDWRDSSLFSGSQSAYLEELYEAYLADPSSISPKWRSIFDALPGSRQGDVSHLAIQQQFAELVKHGPQTVVVEQGDALSTRVQALIEHYRMHGHEAADLDPLGLTKRPPVAALDLAKHGLADVDLKTVVSVGDFGDGSDRTLGQLIADLKAVYSNTIAVEYMDLVSEEQRLWVQSRIESRLKAAPLDVEVQKRILERLTAAEGLERYLGSRYPGAKRFSLEGGDSLIVMLDRMFQLAADKGVKDINIGMAHRGRLTVLVSVLGKKPSDLFSEFEGKYTPGVESGDVKYHQGFSSDVQTAHGPMHLNLAFNPSHLAIVTPVVMGSVKARQIKRQDESRDQIIPIALHGDAAFAGQGVIMEVLNMSQTRGYGVGGTLHIVINNQVGFTTSHPEDSRSTPYCTDVAKMIQSPVFHVNADDVESVFFVAQMAFDFHVHKHVGRIMWINMRACCGLQSSQVQRTIERALYCGEV
ncbi:MAG: thiamine pyrophosphate-dependent enzyme, partial [Pseudomonadota bacterium]